MSIQRINYRAVAAIASINTEGQVVSAMTFEKSLNSQKFIQYLERLRKDVEPGRFTLCLDNLRVHHSIAVK